METHPGEGVMKEKFPNTRKPSNWWVCGEFWKPEGNITGRKNKQLKPTDYEPNSNSPSGEAAKTPAPATSKWGLGREVRAALLRVKA